MKLGAESIEGHLSDDNVQAPDRPSNSVAVSSFSPLVRALLFTTFVESCHGFVGGPDLNLHKVCLPITALWTVCCKDAGRRSER